MQESPYLPDEAVPAAVVTPPAEDRGRTIKEIMADLRDRKPAVDDDAITGAENASESDDPLAANAMTPAERIEALNRMAAGAMPLPAITPSAPPHWSNKLSRKQLDQISRRIARVCHEANRAFCATQGDTSQVAWGTAPLWQIDSAILGVRKIITGEITSPQQSHESWLAEKERDGWVYGSTKDPVKKTHPCMLPHAALPPEQQIKDYLFHGIVTALVPELETARRGALDNVYNERNRVVSAFAHLADAVGWPVWVATTAIEGWDAEWHNCLFINTPAGQVSWHFHDREADLFGDLERHNDREWDGHTTDEKYRRLEDLDFAALTADWAEARGARAIARVCMDMHGALGIEWGDDPYSRINDLKAAEREVGALRKERDELLRKDSAYPGS
jgi:hypothetical protein